MKRRVESEFLDELPADDPRATGSREDLRKLNAWMRNPRIMANALRRAFPSGTPRSILDIGAGDGAFLLKVARILAECPNASPQTRNGDIASRQANGKIGYPPRQNGHTAHSVRDQRDIRVSLLDKQSVVSKQTFEAFKAHRWQINMIQADVSNWFEKPPDETFDAVVANLFLHHFSEHPLAHLLRGAAARTRVFIAVEPRRSTWSLAFSKMSGLIGCNKVTRHDAVVSVRAGFSALELSALWADTKHWQLREGPAGPFSHLFVAKRCELAPSA
jgi:hypothetical protein